MSTFARLQVAIPGSQWAANSGLRPCVQCGAASPRVYCSACTKRIADAASAADAASREAKRIAAIEAGLATIPSRFRWAVFGAPEWPQRLKRTAALDEAAALLDHPDAVLFGAPAAGKTPVACAVLRTILDRARESTDKAHRQLGARAIFVTAYDLGKARKEHPLGEGEAPLVARAKSATLLVLDDLGNEVDKNDAVKEVLFERVNAEAPTIITTEHGVSALSAKYDNHIAKRVYQAPRRVIWCEPRKEAPRA